MSGPEKTTLDFKPILDELDRLAENVKQKINQLNQGSGQESMSIKEMMKLQFEMNKLSQFSDMSTNMIGAVNGAISAINRNIKS